MAVPATINLRGLDASLPTLLASADGYTYFAYDTGKYYRWIGATLAWEQIAGSGVGGSAPSTAHYLTSQAESGLSAEVNLGALTTGLLKIAISGSVATPSSIGLDTDGTLAANSDTVVATQKAVKTYVDLAVTGLLDFKGATNCSGNPNYPAASKGDAYIVSAAGKIGGASGTSVEIGDAYVASADNAGGTEASVGTSWFKLEHNLVGALLTANNLSDVASVPSARSNLGIAYPTGVVTLTDGASIAVDATLGDLFKVTLGGNRTLANPTGAVDGQKMTFRIRQDGTGTRTISLDTKFRFGTDITGVTLTTAAGKTDYLGVIYHAADDKFDVVAFTKGL